MLLLYSNNNLERFIYLKCLKRAMGIAYAFFDCPADKEKVRAELEHSKDRIGASELELSLKEISEGIEKISEDPRVQAIAEEAQGASVRYALEARYEGHTNRKTADALADTLNQFAYCPELYTQAEDFFGSIFYEYLGGYYQERE